MQFKVLNSKKDISNESKAGFYLIEDNWDDWFEFQTLYQLYYVKSVTDINHIGMVKIGEKSQSGRRPSIPSSFSRLDEHFFSLGQDDTYYENLNNLPDGYRENVLRALNDISQNLNLLNENIQERVIKKSLLRDINLETVKGQFHRMAHGGVRLTEYDFSYTAPYPESSRSNLKISFKVVPESNPPTNIHVIIGRNGVGKTHLMNSMVLSLLSSDKTKKYGSFDKSNKPFSNLVLVSFSAFDQKYPAEDKPGNENEIKYTYVGLSRPEEGNKLLPPKSPIKLKNEFVSSAYNVRKGKMGERWKKALLTLESDPIFKEADISSLCSIDDKEEFKTEANDLFHNLSSGHKIVLLTLTRLVETVDEKTLVLLDEPEGHLHPPLLSAFIRALSDLLIQRNGVAIVATHSPVVLQEIPKSCVWLIRRSGKYTNFTRLNMESFGENIGILSSEVFGLELTQSGYHNLLKEVANSFPSYTSAIEAMNGQIGSEGKAILRALIENKGQTQG